MNLLKQLGDDLTGVDGTRLNPSKIKMLETELGRLWPEYAFEVIERFRSRKNIVLHLGALDDNTPVQLELVAKLFVTDYFENELKILRTSYEKGLAVPKVISTVDEIILMQYIDGETLTVRINRAFEESLIDELAEWYYTYHKTHGIVKGDPRLRNFICGNNPIVGLDFEESRPGHWMFDIAGASASLLDTRPVFDTRKRRLIWRLLDKYLELNEENQTPEINHLFINTISDTLEQTAQWRDDDTIMNLARQIRQNGIPVK